ncbi:autotransporter-associated beta strand repeat-containing protein [Verrucomicrobium sp. GAS474]|uniref:beta strand repeat-containing protein n=1 Tax=Verrucomicrobium sp. GAS474 TaxID=1882831 RepID=UPI0013906970|nr:autotransporter-associated beta strand repeat-containing protein [Verrucomicrobium sp. GAS474]
MSLLLLPFAAPLQAAVYTAAAAGNWSVGSNWDTGTPPNAIGAVASATATGTYTLTQDLASVTVGTLAISGNTVFTVSTGTNTLVLNQDGSGSGVATIANASTSTGARLIFLNSPGSALQIADDLQIKQLNASSTANAAAQNYAIQLNQRLVGTGSITVSNVLNDLNYGLVGFQGGTSTAGTYTGAITLASGAMTWTSTTAFGSTSGITLGSSGGGDVSFATVPGTGVNTATVAANITVTGATGGTTVLGSLITSGIQKFTGNVALNQNLTVISQMTTADTTGVALSGIISGTGGLQINGTVKVSTANVDTAGIVQLSGNNTFTGDTRVYAGSLLLGAASGNASLALQNSTLNLASGDTGTVGFGLISTTTITSATLGGLEGSRNLSLQNIASTPAAVALRVGNNNQSTTYSGALTGSGSLTKIGTGTLTLTGANTYAGTTTVSAGTLLVNGSGSLGAGATTVASGATLGGNGTISSIVTVSSGAILLAGTGASASETLTLASASTISSGATLEFVLGSGQTHSTLALASGSSLASALTITLIDLGATTGTYDNIITGVGTSGNLSGWTITNSGYTGTFSYDGLGNIDLTLTAVAVPEPSVLSLLFLAGGCAAAAAIRRRCPA